jgi:hypothetical protein
LFVHIVMSILLCVFGLGFLFVASEEIFLFGCDVPFRVVCVIWFTCVCTTIVVRIDMIVHNIHHPFHMNLLEVPL